MSSKVVFLASRIKHVSKLMNTRQLNNNRFAFILKRLIGLDIFGVMRRNTYWKKSYYKRIKARTLRRRKSRQISSVVRTQLLCVRILRQIFNVTKLSNHAIDTIDNIYSDRNWVKTTSYNNNNVLREFLSFAIKNLASLHPDRFFPNPHRRHTPTKNVSSPEKLSNTI